MAAPLSHKLVWELANPIWASTINPVLSAPTNNSNILKGILLSNGVNIINHGLGRLMQGWIITDIDGVATIYRSAPMNSSTITLTASASVVVNIEVF
jgi:hypothetical protein